MLSEIFHVIHVIIVVVQIYANEYRCGPRELCLCYLQEEMDCTEKSVTLLEICQNIDKQIVKLRAKRNNFKEVVDKDLLGCESLQTLILSENNISLHQNCTFCNLSNLEMLDLSSNMISFDSATFDMKEQFPLKVRVLLLNNNSDTSFSDYYPDLSYMNQLSELYVDGFSKMKFPVSYSKMTQLKSLVMTGLNGHCNVTEITNETLSSLIHVRRLNMSACNIENIFAGSFEQMHDLEILDLSQNRRLGIRMLRNVSYGLQFTNIKSLNMSKVQNTFGMTKMLHKRDICYLWNTSISELVLNSNRIAMIETNTLILLSATVEILHVEDNKFTFGPYILQIGCLSKLKEVYASYQHMSHPPHLYDTELSEKSYDQDILLQDCPFMTEEFLRNINKTNYCHFFNEGQKINITENYPMFPKTLKRVHCAFCSLNYNVTSILVFPLPNEIEFIDGSGNVLHSLVGPVGPFPNMYADLSKNYCSFISSKFFEGVIALENLQLSNNYLGIIFEDELNGPYIFEKLVNVKSLNLSSNFISFIPRAALSAMSLLETLDLSENNIEQWIIDVANLNNLLNLNLRSNFFQTLPKSLTTKLEDNSMRIKRPFSIDMRNNTIKIVCSEKYFLEWVVNNKASFISFDENNFQDMSGNLISADIFVMQIKGLDKKCQSYMLEIVLGLIGVTVFLSIVIAGFIYKNRWNLRYLIRQIKNQHFGYKRLQNDSRNENFKNDAFISYANENALFVVNQIVPKLEHLGHTLCLHDRDFVPGNYIADNIVSAIRESRMTIIILSDDFLNSKWCMYEFNMARMESIYSRARSSCLLVVMYEDVTHRNMPVEMMDWIRNNTYLEYTNDEQGMQLFWENLFEALQPVK